MARRSFAALAAACMTLMLAVRAHSHDGHTCIHDHVIEAAEHAHDSESVQLLLHADSAPEAEPEVLTMTRRELELHPEIVKAGNEHHRRLQSNTASYLARPWGGLRIRVEYVDVDGPGRDPALTQQQADLLKNDILPGVVAKLQAVLQVCVC